jgi:hypothetical protein
MDNLIEIDNKDESINILKYMHNNIPTAVIIVMTMLNRYAFENVPCNTNSKFGIILVFILLTIINFIWTTIRSKNDFTTNYPHTGNRWKYYALWQCITSILSFYSLNYYIHKGVPFNCFFSYNEIAAEIMFYLSFLVITTISYLEHYHWKKIPFQFSEIQA